VEEGEREMNVRHVVSSLAAVLAIAGLAVAASASAETLTIDDLKYEGAAVEVEVDVNGEAAVMLIGGVLDEAARTAQEQIAAGGNLPPQVAMAEPMLEPATQMIKSLSRVSAVIMKTDESAAGLDVIDHYGGKMSPRGWTQLATVRTGKGENILAMLAPGGKGVFIAVRPNGRELIVALITTQEPIGDLLAQVVRAGGGQALSQIMAAKPEAPKPSQGCESAEDPEATETAEAQTSE
jgi:hypothetical protein